MKFSKLFSSKPDSAPKLSSNKAHADDKNSDVQVTNKQGLRDALANIKTFDFPNGIFGQLTISNGTKEHENTWCVELPFNAESVEQEIRTGLVQQGFSHNVEFTYVAPQNMQQAINNVKLVIAVASGKGGVGKSTVTSNLASALAHLGHKVGVLDADIYGPSVPLMFGLQGENVASKDGKRMEPFVKNGVVLNSIGFLVPDSQAVVWRGPMASKALMQVINETNWPELDVLLVDMPPGTGDIQLTMSDTVKCDGALIVTTPQTVALADADKGINMFNKVNTPIVGLVENMSQFVCDGCGKQHALFGDAGGVECAKRHKVPLLAQLPLKQQIREAGDKGQPYGFMENNEYQPLAFSLMMQLSKQTQNIIALG